MHHFTSFFWGFEATMGAVFVTRVENSRHETAAITTEPNHSFDVAPDLHM